MRRNWMRVIGAALALVVLAAVVALTWQAFRIKHPDAPWWTFLFEG